ncbi:tetratricopeptide repeat protein [Methanoculleus sp.]|uniref:tetratricopeptide repeat protein n=1 Tax=Methanoculleus sp. TaxID=90427 RepID=UPI001BD5F506|nr:tetratricopeptide repeat protein [Methanoculleus sp.]
MLNEWNTSIPPPTNWQDFELLCWDIFGETLDLFETKRYGRPGQAQQGVDIFGRSKKYHGWVGLQCKKKDVSPQAQLTEDEILQEVQKARTFTPPIVHYIILTTAPRDAKIQNFVAEISTQNQESGQFSVEIYFWDDIADLLRKNPGILRRHWSFARDADIVQIIGEKFENGQRKTCEIFTDEIRQIRDATTSDLVEHELSNEYREELETVKRELKEHRPSTALRLLEQFKERVWPTAANTIKHRIVTYEAEAWIQLHDYCRGGRLMIEALQCNPEDAKALGNAAAGYYLLGEYDKAKSLALKIIEQNPVSTRGYSLLIQARGQSEPIDTILSEIPEFLQHTHDIASAVGQHFYNHGTFDKAVTWLRIALDDVKNDIAVKTLLASAEYHLVRTDPASLSGLQISEQHKEPLNDAIQLFEEVLGTATEDIGLQKAYIHLLIELADAKWLIGLHADAERLIDWAYKLEGPDHTVLYLKGWYAFQVKNYAEAERFFEQVIWLDPFLPTPLELYLEVLRRTGRAREGIGRIQEFRTRDLTDEQKEVLSREYVRCLISSGSKHFEETLDLAYARVLEDGENIDKRIDYLKIVRYTGRTRDVQEHLDKAKNVASSLPPLKQLEIADILYDFEQYGDAAEIYQRCIDPRQNTEFTQKFIDSCYRDGKHGKALELCRNLHAACSPLPHTAYIELAIYHEIGDMPEAKRLCKEYLSVFHDDYSMKLNQAIVDLRMGALSSVDAFLPQPNECDISSYDQGSRLVRLFYLRNRFDDALELAYRLRKKFHNHPDAHLSYISLVLDIDDRASKLSEPDAVGHDTAAYVEDNFGQKQVYTIEDLNTDERAEHVLLPQDPLAQLLLGKPKGSKIALRKDEFGIGTEYSLTITDIASKYVYAFQESASSFNLRFPHERNGFQRFHLRAIESGGVNPDDLNNLTTIASKKAEGVRRALEVYKQGHITTEGLSRLLGQNTISICSFLTQLPDVGIQCSPKTTRYSPELIPNDGRPRTLILDPVALATIHSLRIGELLTNRYGKCGVAQSTVDIIEEAILEYTGIQERASHTLIIIDDVLVMYETPAEEINKNKKNLEGLLQWVRTNCTIMPCYPALQIDYATKQRYNTLIGPATVDSILLATEPGAILGSDDQVIHVLAQHEFNIRSVFSTPALLLDCLYAGAITRDRYDDLMLRLAAWNYYPLPIDAKLLIAAAEKASWELKTPFTDVIKTTRKICGSDGLPRLKPALALIELLWERPVDNVCRDVLFLYFLTAVAPQTNAGTFVRRLAYMVSIHPDLPPDVKVRVVQDIETWGLIFPKRQEEKTIEEECLDDFSRIDEQN